MLSHFQCRKVFIAHFEDRRRFLAHIGFGMMVTSFTQFAALLLA